MIVWADRWQADGCVELCMATLSRVHITKITLADVNTTLFALPESVKKAAAFANFQAMCKKWLVKEFGDVYAVITDNELLKSFCALSFRVVCVWAALDELVVHTENDVAVLLAFWHAGPIGEQCNEQDLLQLGELLRVGSLTSMFRRMTLPELTWFVGHAARANIFAAMYDCGGAGEIAADRPAAWSAGARNGKLPQNASTRANITELVSEAELGRVLQQDSPDVLHKFGSKRYWHGYFWQVSIEFKEGKVGAFLHNISHGPILQAACVKFRYYAYTSLLRPCILRRETGTGAGRGDLFPTISPITSLEQLQPHIINGFLRVCFGLKEMN